jgi:hypothetical protein
MVVVVPDPQFAGSTRRTIPAWTNAPRMSETVWKEIAPRRL